ncbi:MAG: AAA family ATPase [Candidatus Nomurabacteria bacterium]|nr:AAA family ATPase [Candidatus Nomurabacteria bacterium]
MKENFICLITGPAGAGKSSVTKALADKFERSAVIEIDTLRGMIKGGHVRPYPYTEEVELQLSLSAKNACDITNNLLEKGFNVFIDGIVGRKLLAQYSNFFKEKNFKVFLLMPSVDALLKRFDERGDNEDLRKRTQDLHKTFSEKKDELNCKIIDSSNLTLEETVEEIYKQI